MKLQSIQIKNYRSIEDISFEPELLSDGTYTYGLIGVNEAGKSTILKAIALKEGLISLQSKDFKNKTLDVEMHFSYKLDASDVSMFNKILSEANVDECTFMTIDLSQCVFEVSYLYAHNSPESADVHVYIPMLDGMVGLDASAKELVLETLTTPVSDRVHKSIFWTAEEKYLISAPISLAAFSENPENTSIPLKNCFLLAGIKDDDIKTRIDSLSSDSTEIEQLQTELGEKVTEHIKNVWPNHPITITFLITNGFIHFHVKDTDAKGKAKTADQRSDGFKQFVSFLLTVSAQNKNEETSNTILLLDEPETHLHPKAQEYLLGELIEITKNDRNNIVFFATHSNYMIDRKDLSRNYKIEKQNDKTTKSQFSKKISSYASVTYEVFDIPSSDYHNELFSLLHSRYQNKPDTEDKRPECIKSFDTYYLHQVKELDKKKPWKKESKQSTLPTYIRNCIHHPDNGNAYSFKELKDSIDLLRSYL